MITKGDKRKIKKLFGGRYSREIKRLLDKKGAKNKNGDGHSMAMIRNVMNGLKRHQEIEAAIFELVEEKQALIVQRKKLLYNQHSS